MKVDQAKRFKELEKENTRLKKLVADLGASMGLRPVDVGALTNAGPIEGITAVLATINRRYKLKNSGIKITGLPWIAEFRDPWMQNPFRRPRCRPSGAGP